MYEPLGRLVSVYLCLYEPLGRLVSVYLCLWLCTSSCSGVCMNLGMFVRTCAYACMHARMHFRTHACVCTHRRVFIRIHARHMQGYLYGGVGDEAQTYERMHVCSDVSDTGGSCCWRIDTAGSSWTSASVCGTSKKSPAVLSERSR